MLRTLVRDRRDAFARYLRDRRDRTGLAAVARALPWFAGIEDGIPTARGELEPAWRDYTATVSTPVMAASLELCALLLATARRLRPRRILDLGSGLSSYVLRSFAVESRRGVGGDGGRRRGLARARPRFLASRGLPTGDMYVWEAFAATTPAPFDFVLHDLGSMRVRAATLPRVLELAAPDGIVLLDDLHPKGAPYCDIAPEAYRRAGRGTTRSARSPSTRSAGSPAWRSPRARRGSSDYPRAPRSGLALGPPARRAHSDDPRAENRARGSPLGRPGGLIGRPSR